MAYYYTRDHLGSVRELCSSTGTITSRMAYNSYGRVTVVSGTNLPTKQFTGYYYHAPSGLYLTKFRPYDCNTGRWLSRDPIAEKDGPNIYAYVGNDPTDEVDPFGLNHIYPTNFVGPIQSGDQYGLTCAQYKALKELVARAKAMGSMRAAQMSSITFGDELIEPFNSTYGNTVPTANGDMDLDWFTDVMAKSYAGHYSAIPVYVGGKLFWTLVRTLNNIPIGNALPFEDPTERTAMLNMLEDEDYTSLFDDAFFKKYAPACPCP